MYVSRLGLHRIHLSSKSFRFFIGMRCWKNCEDKSTSQTCIPQTTPLLFLLSCKKVFFHLKDLNSLSICLETLYVPEDDRFVGSTSVLPSSQTKSWCNVFANSATHSVAICVRLKKKKKYSLNQIPYYSVFQF